MDLYHYKSLEEFVHQVTKVEYQLKKRSFYNNFSGKDEKDEVKSYQSKYSKTYHSSSSTHKTPHSSSSSH